MIGVVIGFLKIKYLDYYFGLEQQDIGMEDYLDYFSLDMVINQLEKHLFLNTNNASSNEWKSRLMMTDP